MRKRNYRVVKKAVCLLITGAMILTGVPTGMITNNGVGHVYAEEYTVGESTYIYSVLEDGTVEITGYSGSDTEIIIPGEIDGKKVTYIGEWAFYRCRSMKEITIPEGVTSIGDHAFRECSSLKEINIPEGVTRIGLTAFGGCSGLEEINIPEGVTRIGLSAFNGCSGLKTINVSENNEVYKSVDGVLMNKSGEMLIRFPEGHEKTQYNILEGVISIEEFAFSGCSSLEEIKMPESVTSIGNCEFSGCSGLKAINVSENNKEYKSVDGVLLDKSGELLIRFPEGKTQYIIPEGVMSIKDYAFWGCSSLEEIKMSESVTSIGEGAFSGCSSLETITIPEGVTSIRGCTFEECSSLKEINIPEGVTSIGNYAFSGCNSLKEINLSEGVISIGDYTFLGCSSLNAINVSENNKEYKSIDGVLLDKSGELLIRFPEENGKTQYNIPEGVTSIGDDAFYGCNSLKEINISEGVTSIGDRAFYGCNSLKEINISERVISIGNYTFLECSSLNAINVSENNKEYKSIDGVLLDKSGELLIRFPEGNGKTQYNIPEGVTSIGDHAFRGCSSLKEINEPDSVTSIGFCAFLGCSSLEEINIPENVSSIGASAFLGCSSLKEIKIPKSVEDIGYYSIGYYYNSDTGKDERYNDLVIYGYAGTEAERYATDNSFEYVTIKETFDEEKNIVVEYPEDFVAGSIALKVDELTEKDESYKNLNLEEKIVGTGVLLEDMKFKVYDIKFLDEESNGVQPTGEVTVKLPCPEGYESGKCKVYHIDSEGNVTDMNAVYDGEYFVFTTNHFSVYLVTENTLKTTPEYISGDVNDDGNIDTQDAVLLKKYLAGYTDLGIIEDACDVNNDGNIDSADAVILLKQLAGYEGMLE